MNETIRREYLAIVRSTQALLSAMTPEERRHELAGHTRSIDYCTDAARTVLIRAYGREDVNEALDDA